MFAIDEDELAAGTYWVMCADGLGDVGDSVILLHTQTLCVKRVWLGSRFISLLSSGIMYLLFLNIWPTIRVDINYMGLLTIARLSKLEFKDLHQWELQNCPPFAFNRLVRKGGVTTPFPCKEKLAMFRDLNTFPCLLKMKPNMVLYIVGPIVKRCRHYAHRENLMVIVVGKTLTYKVRLLHITNKLQCLLNHVPSSDGCSYYHLMCSDYVIKLQLNEWGENKDVDVVPLSYTPFYDRTSNHKICI